MNRKCSTDHVRIIKLIKKLLKYTNCSDLSVNDVRIINLIKKLVKYAGTTYNLICMDIWGSNCIVDLKKAKTFPVNAEPIKTLHQLFNAHRLDKNAQPETKLEQVMHVCLTLNTHAEKANRLKKFTKDKRANAFLRKVSKQVGYKVKDWQPIRDGFLDVLEDEAKFAKAFPESAKSLQEMRKILPTAMCSDTWEASLDLIRGLLPDCFDLEYPSCVIGFTKHQIEYYLEVARRFGCRPEECFFVDDNENCLRLAESVGMTTFHIDRGRDARFPAPTDPEMMSSNSMRIIQEMIKSIVEIGSNISSQQDCNCFGKDTNYVLMTKLVRIALMELREEREAQQSTKTTK